MSEIAMSDVNLTKLGACEDAVRWVGDRPLTEAWRVCTRGDWMLWLLGRAELCSRQELVLLACECAELAAPHWPKDVRPRLAIETARRWARGDATLAEVRAAYDAARAAADAAAADAAAAARAAGAAAYAAADADAAAYAAAYAANAAAARAAGAAAAAADAAAYAAADADAAAYADADADADADAATLKKCAEIVRAKFPELPQKEAKCDNEKGGA